MAAPTVIVGMGRSGLGAARLLRHQGVPVVVFESRDSPDLRGRAAQLEAEGIGVRLGTPLLPESFMALPVAPAAVVVSPGIRWDHPTLEALRQRGIPVQGELLAAWRATPGVPWIAITGTNGKTTVTHLVHHLLSQAGLDAPLCGNVGFSAAELALERSRPGRHRPDWLVVEVSSYQIEQTPELAPAIGLWTTLTPDHLERHGTLDNYRAIKRSLLERSQLRILNADDPDLRERAASWDAAEWVTAGPRHDLPPGLQPRLWMEDGLVCSAEGPLFPGDCLAMPGAHNRQNLLMATAVGAHVGLAPAGMEAAFRTFPGVPHRLERLRTRQGVSWFNDSKATNYDAAEVALRALEGPLVVLAGGEAKQGDPRAWLQQLHRQASAVVLFGAARHAFAALLAETGYPGTVAQGEGMEEAVAHADRLSAGGTARAVLLSPACASFDQYRDFEARGDHFRQLVAALPD
ncbi:MAG: UDP-N-acetylmuramoyl-L-alanine--D-glutamate ligase [Synechococcaceae cyanobacterium]|nr:UDP-N-acetylmuramoyl-L-alanine--D-glutamate ligase [Synechococcaceae cyanobacterium]